MRSHDAWTALLMAATLGCGAVPSGENATNESGAIAGGTIDHVDSAVFQEFTNWPNGSRGSVSACTASLIAPNVLLTARHCISPGDSREIICGSAPFEPPVAGRATVATNATAPSNGSTYYRGAEVRVPTDGSDICGFDVALIILESSVPKEQATPLIPRVDRVVEAGEEYRAVGYGVNEGGEQNPGRMERRNLTVRCSPGDCRKSYAVAPTEFMGETGVCSGDSGGPALDTDGKVIGVVSRGSDPCETPIYGQVAAFRDWITDTVFEAAERGGYRAPFWAFSGSSELDESLLPAGESCSDTSECAPGTVCYFESEPSAAVCTPVCASDAQCGKGSECRSGFDVQGGGLCFAPPDDAPGTPIDPGLPPQDKRGANGSCAMSAAPTSSVSSAWLALALALAAAARKKKPRPS